METPQDQFQRLLREAQDDPYIIGVVLTGSRGKGRRPGQAAAAVCTAEKAGEAAAGTDGRGPGSPCAAADTA